jgi:CheY-like chemotaxis protein
VEAGGGDVAAAADKPATHTLHATVTDRGRGLTLHDCEHVFEAYEASSSANGGGTGLGLFIARTGARRAGGDVSVVSEPGRGAAFTLRFPVHVSPAVAAEWEAATRAWQQRQGGGAAEPACIAVDGGAAPHTPPQPTEVSVRGKRARSPTHAAPPSTLRCLLADDHPLNLLLVKRLLEQHAGLAVETAANGKQAYDQLVAAFDAGRQPHVAVIDMQMPIWSGPGAWEARTRATRRRALTALRLRLQMRRARFARGRKYIGRACGCPSTASQPTCWTSTARSARLPAWTSISRSRCACTRSRSCGSARWHTRSSWRTRRRPHDAAAGARGHARACMAIRTSVSQHSKCREQHQLHLVSAAVAACGRTAGRIVCVAHRHPPSHTPTDTPLRDISWSVRCSGGKHTRAAACCLAFAAGPLSYRPAPPK